MYICIEKKSKGWVSESGQRVGAKEKNAGENFVRLFRKQDDQECVVMLENWK